MKQLLEAKQLFRKLNHKGTGPKDIPAFVILIAITGMVLAFTMLILANVQTEVEEQTSNLSAAYNATGEAIDAGATFGEWLPLIVLVIVAVIIIALILRGFGRGKV